MSNKLFTKEEIQELSKNKYVKHVSEKGITYTQEFKEEFIKKYNNGELPTEIFRGLGFDTQIIGQKRISSCAYRFQTYNERLDGFVDKRKDSSGRPKTKNVSLEEQLARAQEKILYLQQENEFLKKIRRVERTVKKTR